MELWKSGSQMTRTIDLRHWAQRGDIVPRCGVRTFSALEGSVPMTIPLESGSRHTSIRGAMFWSSWKGPEGSSHPGASRVLGAKGA